MKGRMYIRSLLVMFLISLITVIASATLLGQQTQEIPKLPTPFLLTPAGQTPDTLMAKIIAQRAKLDMKFVRLATVSDMEGVRTLLLVMGTSMKGLGTAGVKLEDEMGRVNKLIAEAEKNNMKVVGMHLGGAEGRDKLCDSLLSKLAPKVDYLVVVKSGDRDGLFTNIASENKIPLIYMKTVLNLKTLLPEMFPASQ